MSANAGASNHAKLGEACFQKVDKINGELFTLTYGAMVTQLLKDYENQQEVNAKLESMGYSIGVRLVDEMLAKSGVQRCSGGFRETCEVVAKVGFKMFLGIAPEVSLYEDDDSCCLLTFKENPLGRSALVRLFHRLCM